MAVRYGNYVAIDLIFLSCGNNANVERSEVTPIQCVSPNVSYRNPIAAALSKTNILAFEFGAPKMCTKGYSCEKLHNGDGLNILFYVGMKISMVAK